MFYITMHTFIIWKFLAMSLLPAYNMGNTTQPAHYQVKQSLKLLRKGDITQQIPQNCSKRLPTQVTLFF